MCYKDEVQKKNADKLRRKFEQDNVPAFISDYFYNLNSEAGKLNETVINPPAELGRLTDAGGGEQSIKIENSAV